MKLNFTHSYQNPDHLRVGIQETDDGPEIGLSLDDPAAMVAAQTYHDTVATVERDKQAALAAALSARDAVILPIAQAQLATQRAKAEAVESAAVAARAAAAEPGA